MKMRRCITGIIIILSGLSIHAQTEIPNKIRISTGRCSAPCGYSEGFNNLFFIKQLEFDLNKSKFFYRKKTKRKFKYLKEEPTGIFLDPKSYQLLDSLYENFADFQMSPGKFYIYRIELIYCKSKNGLPSKIKTMDFLLTTNPNRVHPPFIEKLIKEYRKIIFYK